MSHRLHLADEGRSAAPRTGARLIDNAAVLPRHGTESLTGVGRQDLPAHRAAHGPRLSYLGHLGDDLVAAMEAVHLTGRGGGHFPAAAKWRSVAAHGPSGTVVVNGAEGEPGCAKDAVLLQTRPHLVLDGLVAAIEFIGATEGVVWIHEGAWQTAQSVTHAIAERIAAREGDPPIRVIARARPLPLWRGHRHHPHPRGRPDAAALGREPCPSLVRGPPPRARQQR